MVVKAVGALGINGGMTPELERSPLADLLRSMVPHLQRLGSSLVLKWMRSHGTCEQEVAHGVPALAWQCNGMADQAAKAEAARLAPPAALCHERNTHAALHLQTCRLIAAVH